MSPGYLLYNTIISLTAPLILGAAARRGRLKGYWRQRLGFYPDLRNLPGPRIWLHAVSAGEVQVAIALATALKDKASELSICLTTTTTAGLQAAQSLSVPDVQVLIFPLDAYGGPGRALARIRPDLVILLETELWPNFLRTARLRGVRTMLANGRISPRSIGAYRRVRFLIREVLNCLDLMAMIRPEDRERIIALGADPARVQVVGNAKYDLLLKRFDAERVVGLRDALGLSPDQLVLVAGSTRSGEEALVLQAFQRLRADFPRLHLILAPRHVHRAAEVESLVRAGQWVVNRRSAGKNEFQPAADVTLVDVMGELFFLYGLASVAFCGASLIPLGGQNPLEPAVWGKPVLYGPSMEDFLDARQMLESAGGGQTIRNVNELYIETKKLLEDPALAARRGQAARKVLDTHQGSAGRFADMALELLAMDKRRAT